MNDKPKPRIDAVNAPFFAACNDEKLLIQRCRQPECRRYIYYPRVCCPACHGGNLDWMPVSGRGRIASFTIVHRPHHRGFACETPYIFAAVRIEEGPIIYGRLETDPMTTLSLEAAVEPLFVQHTPDQKLLAFRPAGTTGPSRSTVISGT